MSALAEAIDVNRNLAVLLDDAVRRMRLPDAPASSGSRPRRTCDTAAWVMAQNVEERLRELGIELPPASRPVANYLSCKQIGDRLYVGGHGPVSAEGVVVGKVGAAVSLEDGRRAARATALSILATIQDELGTLDRVREIVRVFGMVNCAPGFNQTPQVIDGCSDVLVEIFGERGRHTRSAIGVAELPFDIAVEIEMEVQVD